MTKTITTIYLDTQVLEAIKGYGINVSKFVENAFLAEIEKRKGTKEVDEKVVEDMLEQQQKAIETMQAASTIENNCIAEDRALWNETYVILKEKKSLPPINTPERIYKRFALYQELKAKKDAETKEFL